VLGKDANVAIRDFSKTIYLHGKPVNEGTSIGGFTEKGNPASFRFLEGYEPDFNNGIVEIFESNNPIYGTIKSYRILSANKQVQFIFNVDSESRVWIGAMQAVTPRLTRFGVRADVVTVSSTSIDGRGVDLLMPAYEYPSQTPARYQGKLKGEYCDASGFINQLPVIREFRAKVLGERGAVKAEQQPNREGEIDLPKGAPYSIDYSKPIAVVLPDGVKLSIYRYEDILDSHPLKSQLNPRLGYFIIQEGVSEGFKGLRDGEVVDIGRNNPGRFTLNDSVSREHLRIERKGDRIFLLTVIPQMEQG